MERRRTGRGLPGIAGACTAVLLIAFFYGEMDLYAIEAPLTRVRWLSLGFAALVPLCLAAAVFFGRSRLRQRLAKLFGRDARNLAVLAAAAVLPRALWWAAAPQQIVSDYALYVRLGQEFAATGGIARDTYLLAVAPGAPVFGAILGCVMRVFGATELTARCFCMALHLGNLYLLYFIARKRLPAAGAFAAAAAFALLPENVFYSTLPGVEAAALFTMLAGILLVLKAGEKEGAAELLLCACGGLLLFFSACIRASAWAAVIAAAVLLLRDGRKRFARRLAMLAALALAAAPVLLGQQAFRNRVFRGEKPAGGLGWSLYEGLDLAAGGRWTEEKSAHCIEVIDTHGPEEADRVFLREALERYRGYTPAEKARLFLRKGGAMWYESRYALITVEGTADFDKLNDLTAFAWTAWTALLAGCLLYRLRRPLRKERRDLYGFCLTVILLTAAWHQAGTSIGRYHYMLIPFALLTACLALPGAETRARRGKEEEP